MRWRFWVRTESNDAREAREAREAAEARLRAARHNVVVPLSEMRQDNHVSARLDVLITRAARHRGG
jgi:hypothetical protein